MAPTMLSIETQVEDKVDIVLLNVDNSRWFDLIDKYQVNGIPQLTFFDQDGSFKGNSIGLRTDSQLSQIVLAMLSNQSLPNFSGIRSSESSILNFKSDKEVFKSETYQDPMGHG